MVLKSEFLVSNLYAIEVDKRREGKADTITERLFYYGVSIVISLGIFLLQNLHNEIITISFVLYGIPLHMILRKGSFMELIYNSLFNNILWLAANYVVLSASLKSGNLLEFGINAFGPIGIYFTGWLLIANMVYKERALHSKYRQLTQDLAISNSKIKETFEATIEVLTNVVEVKDKYTKGHSQRVGCYSLALAKKLGISPENQRSVFIAAVLHDIGKIGVPDHLLNKPGGLTCEEYSTMQQHAVMGAKIIASIEHFSTSVDMVKYHHERFDGHGYPEGLKNESIPLGARIIAVADTFDALFSNRIYHQHTFTLDEALLELRRSACSQLDPKLVEVFTKTILAGDYCLDFYICLNSVTD